MFTHVLRHALAPLRRCHARRVGTMRLVPSLGAVLLLGGCASFSPDGGMLAVNEITAPALGGQAEAIRTPEHAEDVRLRVKALLRRPLSADRAVQVAVLNNRDLQAAYNTLALSDAARVQASLPPNPTFSLERIAGAGAFEVEGRIVGSLLQLATLPARSEIATDRYRQAQLRAASETLRIATEARRAFYRAVAASALVNYLEQATETGKTAVELARRLGETGAMNKLDQARNQALHAELVAQLGTARVRAAADRERLVRVLGLWGEDLAFRLPTKLPAMPSRARDVSDIEREAVRRRLDLQIARIEADTLAKSHGLTNATRFINLLDVAGIAKKQREDGETVRERGFEVEVQIPIFDFGEVKVRQAEEAYLQAVNRLTAKAVNVRSEAREAYRTYRATYDIARHYHRNVLPIRKIITDETLLRYNAMQIDVFALLTEARQRIAATNAAIEAERDYWLAETNLGAAVLGGDTASASPESNATAAAPEAPGGH
jgi:outer membrane protein TolC